MTRLRTLLSLALLIALTACLPSRGQDAPEIVRGVIGGQEYFVPRAYLKLPGLGLAEQNIYVLAFYPDFRPAWDSHNAIWREGKWKYNVMILASYAKVPVTLKTHLDIATGLNDATEFVGIEYGLHHYTQPKDKVQDHRDIWVETEHANLDRPDSYVHCSKPITENSVPQCRMEFVWNRHFLVGASFNRELLPHWRSIKDSTDALLNSFRAEDTAIAYFREHAAYDTKGVVP